MVNVLRWERHDDTLTVETAYGRLLMRIIAQCGENNFALHLLHGGYPVCHILRDIADCPRLEFVAAGATFEADDGVWRVREFANQCRWKLDPAPTVR